MNNQIFEEVDRYIEGLFPSEDETLTHAIQNIAAHHIIDLSISPVQGQLLQVLVKSCNASRVLELGTLGGYSTIWMAKGLPDHGKIVTIESDELHAKVAAQNIERAGQAAKVEIKTGKALDILPLLADEDPFDFIFIDADKPPYTEYFQHALKLSRKGTFIVCDNVIRGGRVMDEQTNDEKVEGVQRFNKFLSTCKEVDATILQTVGAKEHDGMALAIVK